MTDPSITSATAGTAVQRPSVGVEEWDTSERVIEPVRGFAFPKIRELAQHTDLIYFLARRDIAVRYKQTAVGIVWAVLQPVLFAVVFSVFLGVLAKVPSGDDVPYPVFAVTGLTLWIMFTTSFSRSSSSLVDSSSIVSKVFFPRIIVPTAAALPPLVDFAFAFIVALATMLIYGVIPIWRIVLVPAAVLLALMLALGAGFWLAALNVKYRDVGLIVPFVVQVGMFATPIIYPASLVPAGLQALYALNPLVGVFELYRWALFADAAPPGLALVFSVAVGIGLTVTGAVYFQRSQADFADYL